ncbi:MAG: hypothetical protein H7334_12200 [Ferruginibacter sp.]|nr:hypothetical protein [Ferruginibacter sp.]
MSKPILNEEMKVFFKNNYIKSNPESLQEVLVSLKVLGYTQNESLFLLYREMGISFIRANKIISNSKAWSADM